MPEGVSLFSGLVMFSTEIRLEILFVGAGVLNSKCCAWTCWCSKFWGRFPVTDREGGLRGVVTCDGDDEGWV